MCHQCRLAHHRETCQVCCQHDIVAGCSTVMLVLMTLSYARKFMGASLCDVLAMNFVFQMVRLSRNCKQN